MVPMNWATLLCRTKWTTIELTSKTPWISTHHLGCGVSTLRMWRCHVYLCVHHPGSVNTIWDVVSIHCACVYVSCVCMRASPWISTHWDVVWVHCVCVCHVHVCMHPCLRCVYLSVHVCMSVTDMYACIFSIGTFNCMFACVSIHTFVCMHEHVCVLDLECACVRVPVCVCDHKTTFYCICSYNSGKSRRSECCRKSNGCLCVHNQCEGVHHAGQDR